jgi:hypothetical protein
LFFGYGCTGYDAWVDAAAGDEGEEWVGHG